jgi:hemolysin III
VNVKPRLRGVSHAWACLISVPLGAVLVIAAASTRARLAVAVYALSLVALFGVSALYHRIDWRSVAALRWMRRLDHSMIFVLIAGTYTPFALLVLHGRVGTVILITVWAGAVGGVLLNLVWPQAPRRLAVITYIALGWVAIGALPQLATGLGAGGLSLLVIGGALYSTGGAIYATKRPDPVPAVFGYHEVFHVLVIVAAAVQYAVIAFWVLPR